MGSPNARNKRRLSPSVEGEGSSGYSWFLFGLEVVFRVVKRSKAKAT